MPRYFEGQPIGINDIDGREICEGDTVAVSEEGSIVPFVKMKVEYVPEFCSFNLIPYIWLELVEKRTFRHSKPQKFIFRILNKG